MPYLFKSAVATLQLEGRISANFSKTIALQLPIHVSIIAFFQQQLQVHNLKKNVAPHLQIYIFAITMFFQQCATSSRNMLCNCTFTLSQSIVEVQTRKQLPNFASTAPKKEPHRLGIKPGLLRDNSAPCH
jgi:hypothetical protein